MWALTIALVSTASTVYMSPVGKDTAAGLTKTQPVASLTRAIALCRETGAKTISVAAGTYEIASTVKLGADDSGLQIIGEDGKLPKFTGARPLGSWRKTDLEGGNVYETDVPSSIDLGNLTRRGFGLPRHPAGLELSFGGSPMPIAQYPNDGWLRLTKPDGDKAFTFSDPVPNSWKPSTDLWVLGYWTFDWAESYEHVASLSEGKVTTDEKGGTYGYAPGRRFRFLNALEALDSPGEWVLDRTTRKLYFWPPTPLAEKEATASVLTSTMFELKGCTGVTLSGVCLEGGRDSAMLIEDSSKIAVKNCLIRNFGTYGIYIANSHDSIISGCDLTGLGESGITLSGGDRMTLTPGNLVAEDNHIWAYSRWCRTYQPAIQINGVGNKILRNKIHDAPHEAIALSGNDHLIEGNDISRVCLETGDAGAIYMGRDPTMRGNVIRHNHFTEMSPKVNTDGNFTGVMCVYLDDCFCGTTVDGNIIESTGTGMMLGGGRDNVVVNNVFLGCKPAISFDARGIGWAKAMFADATQWGFHQRYEAVPADKPPYTTRYPQLATYWVDNPAFPKGNVIQRNIAFGSKWLSLQDKLTDKDFAGGSNVTGSNTLDLQSALKLAPKGFQPIPLGSIGLETKKRPSDRV